MFVYTAGKDGPGIRRNSISKTKSKKDVSFVHLRVSSMLLTGINHLASLERNHSNGTKDEYWKRGFLIQVYRAVSFNVNTEVFVARSPWSKVELLDLTTPLPLRHDVKSERLSAPS